MKKQRKTIFEITGDTKNDELILYNQRIIHKRVLRRLKKIK